MSSGKKQYDVFKGLLSGNQVNTLSKETIMSCVAEKALSDLGDAPVVYVLHDPCDVRKPYSSDMEDIGKVLSLKKTVVNGYSSFNSVAVQPHEQQIHLLSTELYSNVQANYVSQEHLKLVKEKSDEQTPITDKKGFVIDGVKYNLVISDTYINGSKIAKNQILASSILLKKDQPNRLICHVLDREFDNENIFKHIE